MRTFKLAVEYFPVFICQRNNEVQWYKKMERMDFFLTRVCVHMGIEEKVKIIKDFPNCLVFLANTEKLCIKYFFSFLGSSRYSQ